MPCVGLNEWQIFEFHQTELTVIHTKAIVNVKMTPKMSVTVIHTKATVNVKMTPEMFVK